MIGKLIYAEDREFTNKKGELTSGINLTFLVENGKTKKLFVYNDQLSAKGFDSKMLATIKGPDIDISTSVENYGKGPVEILDRVKLIE